MKSLKEQIEVMTYFMNGGEVEQKYINEGEFGLADESPKWQNKSKLSFDWTNYNYRIKEKEKTVTIEKWLVKTSGNVLKIEEQDKRMFDCEDYNEIFTKVKLLESYEVYL